MSIRMTTATASTTITNTAACTILSISCCGHLHLPQQVQDDVLAVYGLIAEAESRAHGMPVEEIHFHEVGTMDAIADVTAVCLLMNRLAPDAGRRLAGPRWERAGALRARDSARPRTGDGVYPAGRPDLRRARCRASSAPRRARRCCAISPRASARCRPCACRAIGYGMGKKDFEAANCVRAMLGERRRRRATP